MLTIKLASWLAARYSPLVAWLVDWLTGWMPFLVGDGCVGELVVGWLLGKLDGWLDDQPICCLLG